MDKKQLRKNIKAKVRELSPESKLRESNEVFGYIEATEVFGLSKNIMLFASLPDEIPTHHIIGRWAKSKNIYLPRVNGDDLEIIKYQPGKMEQGSVNIMEPTGDSIDDLSILDLVIVPGVAFDRNGNRCGRGKGFYDRFLSKTHATTIAVCFDCQLIDELPVEPHDIPADYIVTCSYKSI